MDVTEPAVGSTGESRPFGWPRELDADYELLGELGRGGMAVVYRARDRELGREVAIKVVRPRFAADDDALARLAREARTVAQLEHPNIVGLYAVKRLADHTLALVMQLVPGRTLKAELEQKGAFTPARAEKVLRDIARALAYAHRCGVVHRDVKPENIFLDEVTGRALLSDFGVARQLDQSTEVTATGTAIGTPTYMAPEQIDGGQLDGRSDLYSLGLVGWEMFTGQRPWSGESLYTVIYRQKHDALPPIDWFRDDVPLRLQFLIEGLLHKRPERRWNGAARLLSLMSSEAPIPGFSEWQSAHRRRQRQRVYAESRARGNNVITAAFDTVKFARPDTPEVAEPVAPEESEGPPVELPSEPEERFSSLPYNYGAISELERPPRRRVELLLIGVTLAAGVFALGVVVWRQATPADPGASTMAINDRAAVEVPVLPTRDSAMRDSVRRDSVRLSSALATSGVAPKAATRDSTTRLIDSLRAEQARLATAATANPVKDSARSTDATPAKTRSGSSPDTKPTKLTPAERREAARLAARDSALARAAAAKRNERSAPPARVADTPPAPPAVTIPTAPPVAFPAERALIAAGGRHSCVLDERGRARCWGNNDRGQLGDGGFEGRPVPAAVLGDLTFSQLAAGDWHTCALTRDGDAFCWGSNDAGQLGDGTTSPRAGPVRVGTSGPLRSLRAGQAHTCGVSRAGAVVCWGANAFGQIGDGSKNTKTSPVAVNLPAPAAAVAVGRNHTCALTTDGVAYCWGQNSAGQLGDGSLTDRTSPVAVTTGLRFVSIAAGWSHSCAISTSGAAHCWGRNSNGQLGAGTVGENAVTPLDVPTGNTFTTIVAGAAHTCARTRDSRAWCWGRNVYGQLGDGSTIDRARPVSVRGGMTFSALSAMAAHTCGVTPGGDAFCWGYNIDGQVGTGDRDNANVPVRVPGPSR